MKWRCWKTSRKAK